MNTDEFHRKLTAILSADVQGYSRLMEEDEDSTVRNLTACRALMSSLIQSHRGHVVDTPGDNLLAKFDSVMDAVRCAVEIQEELRIRNSELPENRKMQFRVGINLGDIIEEGDHIYGDGINVAARIEGLAEGGGICISGFVYGAIKNKLSLSFEFIGEHSVKNIKDPVRVYRIRMEPDAAAPIVKKREAKLRTWQRVAFPVAAIFILGAVAIWYFYFRQMPVVSDDEESTKTIAVLPFYDLSPEKDQEYFVLGLSEEILNSLAQIKDLTVMAKTSSFSFQDTNKNIQEIADVLGVDHILEGSVRKAGNALRITAQLVKAVDGSHLWSKTYDKEFKVEEMFSVQQNIATAVANELKVTLGVGESLKQLGGTDNVEAYELYLAAKGRLYNPPEEWIHALESTEAAIKIDPEFALAWVLKGYCQASLPVVPGTDYKPEIEGAVNSVLKAIELEPNLPEAYVVLGHINMQSGNWFEAGSAFQKALDRRTEYSWDFGTAICVFYNSVGYLTKATKIHEEVLNNDPLNMIARSIYVMNLVSLGDLEGAEEANRRGKALVGEQWWMGTTYLRLMNDDNLNRDEIVHSGIVADAVKDLLGSPEKALSALRRLYGTANKNSMMLVNIAEWISYFGDADFALDVMEKATALDHISVCFLWTPVMKKVRQLPRFKEFVREIGLVDYWNEFGWPDLCHPTEGDDFVCD